MKFSDKIFLLPIIILAANFLYRLKDFSEIMYRFPLDITNDLTAYIADIPFFDLYGFFGHVPLWYNGFTLFNIYPPGWVLFTYPIYKIVDHLMLAIFLSTIILFILGFLATWLIGKEFKISSIKRTALFLFLFANPMMIGAILKQGRLPSLMAFVLLLYLFYLCLYFKDRPFNAKAIFLPIVYALLILTHQTETILGSAFILGLFFVKNKQEKIKLALLMSLSILFSSFWVFHFLQAAQETGFLQFQFNSWLTNFDGYFLNNIAGILLSLTLFIVFYIFYSQKQEKNLLYFFFPTLLFNFLYLTRLALFIPILKHIYPDPWQDFIIINLSILFVATNYALFTKKWKTILAIGIVCIACASVAYNILHTPYMQAWNTEGKEAIALIPYLNQDSHFLMFNEDSKELYSRAIYSYAAIYYNVSSSSGWFEVNKEYSYILELNSLYKEYQKTENCESLKRLQSQFNTTEILANGRYCEKIKTCGWKIKEINGSSCILSYF